MYKSEHLAKENIQIVNKHISELEEKKKKSPWWLSGKESDNAIDSGSIPYPGRSHMPRSHLAGFFHS